MKSVNIINLETHGDERGGLVSIESLKNIPFEIKRIYYLFDCDPEKPRGFHAHKDLRQIYVAVAGSCIVEFCNGKQKKQFHLNDPSQGIIIDGIIWREIKQITTDCVLLVLADDFYKESDYIRSYEEFLKYINQ